MSALVFALVCLAGGLGAAARLLLDGVLRGRTRGTLPWGTIVINLSGSLLLGILTGLAAAAMLPQALHQLLGAGFLGGYTTFSTASFDTVRLLRQGRWVAAAASGLGTMAAATALAGLGIWLALAYR